MSAVGFTGSHDRPRKNACQCVEDLNDFFANPFMLWKRIQNLLNSGLDPRDTEPEVLRQIRLVNTVALPLILIAFPFIPRYLNLGIPHLALGVLLIIVLTVCSMIGLRYRPRPNLFGHIVVLAFYVLLVHSNSASGGFYDTNFGWLYVVPVVAGLLLGLGVVWFYAGLVMITTVVFFYLPEFGITVPHLIPPEERPAQALVNRLGAVLVLGVLVFAFLLERGRAESELKRARNRAEEAGAARIQFLANMSHEIRTPLNAILGMGDLLREEPRREDRDKYLRVMSDAGANLLALVNDILDLSRLEADALRLHPEWFDLEVLVTGALEIHGRAARARGLRLTSHIDEDVPRRLFGDPVRLRQVFLNIVGNAVKFTEAGEVAVHVRGGPRLRARRMIEFQFRDTGPGIPERMQGRIFEPFTQADATTTRRYGGTGLGLAIVMRLIELQGGSIRVESEPGRGSLFVVSLPFVGDEEQARVDAAEIPGQPAHESERVAGLAEGGREARILLVEDNEDNRFLVESYLKQQPCELHLAVDGKVAVERFRESRYDLVFMDIQMPVMDGLTATRHIRDYEQEEITAGRRAEPTAIYALTAHAYPEEIQRCLRAGCTGHISKPVKKETLLRLIREHAGSAGGVPNPETQP